MSVIVDGQLLELYPFRSFIYKQEQYTIFIDPEEMDEYGDPICYCYKKVFSNHFETMEDEVAVLLSPFIISQICDRAVFGRDFVEEFEIVLLPYGH